MSSSDSEESTDQITLVKVVEPNATNTTPLLPKKSEDRYTHAFEKFMKWRADNNITSYAEDVFLAYFEHISSTVKKPTSLWSHYSMLRSTINAHVPGVDIADYIKLKSFLKTKSAGHVRKKAIPFTNEQVNTFVENAPNSRHLLDKIVLILSVSGACRKSELKNLKIQGFSDTGTTFIVNVKDSDADQSRRFVVPDKFHSLISSYIALRPEKIDTDAFFLHYQNEKCTRQAVGLHKLGNVSRVIAKYLKLPNPEGYTSHSLHMTAIKFDRRSVKVHDRKGHGDDTTTINDKPVHVNFNHENGTTPLLQFINCSVHLNINLSNNI